MASYDSEDLRIALDELSSTKSNIQELEDFFNEQHTEEWAKWRELTASLSGLQETAKTFLRQAQPTGGNVEAFGHVFVIKKGNKEVKIDTFALMERATERNEVDRLMNLGFIEYAVKADQLDRLPGELKAIYGAYVHTTSGTPKVSLPKSLS